MKYKIMLIGIAGSFQDFLLSIHALKCFLYQDKYIKDRTEIILRQYRYIPPETFKKGCAKILWDIEKTNPDLLGFSCYLWNMKAVQHISKQIKQRNKDIKIVLGGPEITEEDTDNYSVDFLICGEGEKPLQKLVRSLIGSQNIRKTESNLIEHLDKIPSPYLEGYVSDEILSRPRIRINTETQRGCNFRCAYCGYHKNLPRIRYRDADTVIKEIEYVFKKGVKAGRIVDANFLSDREFAKKIITGLIKRKIKMSLVFEVLPQFVNGEIADLFGQFIRISSKNRIVIGIGIQSLNSESLRVIRRKIPLRYFERAFNLLQKQDVLIKSDLILGLPRETKETYFEAIEYVSEKMRYGTNYLSLALLRVLPGTEMVEIAKREDLTLDARDNYHFVYVTPDIPREDMLECLRINTAAFRLLSSLDRKNRMKIRDMYFDVKDALQATNIELFQYFASEFLEFLKDSNVSYVKDDFPNPEPYYENKVHSDVPDEWVIKKLESLKKVGL